MNDEYLMLRKEMDSNIDKLHTYISVIYTAIIALIAYILDNADNLHLFSLIFVALICIATRIRALLQTNMRISTYMEVFLEPMDTSNYKWETLSHKELNETHKSIYSIGGINKFIASLFFKSQSVYLLIGLITFLLYICSIFEYFTIKEYFEHGYIISGIFNILSLILLIYVKNRCKQSIS